MAGITSKSRNDARMPHCLRWGGMASLLGGLGDRFPQHDRDLPSKAPPLAAGIFTADPLDRSIPPEQRRRIEQLLCERLSLRGICRTMGVSLTWLLHFMVECFMACPDHLHAQLPAQPTEVLLSRLYAEAAEMLCF